MLGFVGVDSGVGSDVVDRERDAFGLGAGDEGLGGPVAFPEGDDDAALAILIFGLAPVAAVFLVVGRTDLAAEIRPSTSTSPASCRPSTSEARASRSL